MRQRESTGCKIIRTERERFVKGAASSSQALTRLIVTRAALQSRIISVVLQGKTRENVEMGLYRRRRIEIILFLERGGLDEKQIKE